LTAAAVGLGPGSPPPGQDDGAGFGFEGQIWKATEGTPLGTLSVGEEIGGAVAPGVGGSGNPELRVSGDPIDPPIGIPELDGVSLDPRHQGRKFGQVPTPKQLEPDDFSID